MNIATFNFEAHLARQAAFSALTFGPGAGTEGICDHIRKELVEVAAAPSDLKEWIDVAILALDGAWRCGATPAQIIEALVAKQTKNEGRAWPDWRTADPSKAIEHDRSGEQAVVAAAQVQAQEPVTDASAGYGEGIGAVAAKSVSHPVSTDFRFKAVSDPRKMETQAQEPVQMPSIESEAV